MHDQIQAMGRGIVYGENLMEPGERSRLWSCNKILEILKERKGTQKIEGILLRSKYKLFPWDKCLNKKKIAACLHKEDFAMMSKLRFLDIQVACFVADFPHLPSSLRWLSWKRCCLETVQDNFYHKKLVYMDLSGSQIRQAWTKKPQSENQRFQKLKVLRLQHCQHLFESPDFSWFPYLERLDLRACKRIVNLDTSIGDLKSLIELNLHGTKIKELPDSICRLSSLKCLILGQCVSLEKLPQSIGDLKSLVELHLRETKIKELPDSTCRLGSLKCLILGQCLSLEKLPQSIGDLKSLVELDLHRTKIEELPDSICRQSSLKKLDLNGCKLLKKLPELPSTLTCWNIGNCSSLQKLPDLSCLKNVQELRLQNYKKLEEIQGLGGMKSLEVILVYLCDTIESLLELPSTLTFLEVKSCISLQKLPDFSSLKNLRKLRLGDCKKLEVICGLVRMESLQEFSMYGCDTIESLPEFPSTLTYLEVGICISLKKLADFSSLKNLREIKLSNCKKLEEIRGLGETESLEDFLMYECDNIESFPELPSTLARLEVGKCFSLQKLPDLSSLKNLKELKIYDCKKLEEIRGLGGTIFLKKLSLYECDIIESLSELPLALSDLNVGNCVSLQKLPDFSTLKNLRELRLRNCKKLEEIRGLGGSGSLEEFSVHECDTIESLPKLPSTLARLDVVNCISLQKLPSLSNLKNLRETCLFKCKKLEEIRGLEETKSLEWFAISIYETITDAPGKILGKGTLLVNPFSSSNSLNVNDGKYNKLVLCLVFALDRGNVQEVLIKLTASIRRKDRRRTLCDFEITIESIEFTSERDMIYIHQFKGFELFGFPLEGIDAIEEIIVKGGYDCKVKFWKLILLENTEPEQEIPNQESSAGMVADFFRWSYHDDDDDAGEEMKIVSYPSSYEDGDNRDSHPSTNEGMLRATKRARLDVDEEAGGPSGA
ncbi:disease resistance protein RUN1-like [Macadamia integrifolia]|uniref:disease resistance protein RUN1-like n=1 Tax=Macadamia integrifolia TaxID=60698 RepID=UPI001C5277D2|nr:disease resistance protein RUN1-like [Macadamia integrifolia]